MTNTDYKTHSVTVSFSKLGQASPHIDLKRLVGCEVYAKINKAQTNGESYANRHMIGRVVQHVDCSDTYVIQGNYYNRDGSRSACNRGYIEAIYPVSAFTVLTADVEPAPESKEVTEAKKALKKLTPEQLKQLIDKITEAGE